MSVSVGYSGGGTEGENDKMAPRKPASRGPNKQYFRNLLLDRQLSQRQLAKLMGLDQSSVVRGFQGARKFTTHEVAKLAQLLQVPLEEVLSNLDVEVPHVRSKGGGAVPVTGYTREGYVHFGKPVGPGRVPAPPGEISDGLKALRCADEGALEGAYFYYRPGDDIQSGAIGRLSVCNLAGGKVVLATPSPTGHASFALRDVVGRVLLEEAWLESASPVIWIKTA